MERDRDDVRRDIEETRERMATRLEELSHRADDARERASDIGHDVRQRYDSSKARVRGARERLRPGHYVERRPWLTLGVSVAAGWIAGRIAAARAHHHRRRRYH